MRTIALWGICVLGCLPASAVAGLPLAELRYEAAIVGPLAEVKVHQVFVNDSSEPTEALYVFPLHENAAVDAVTMRIGDRVIDGQIEENSEAQALYDDAIAAGHTVAMTSQNRPNVFEQVVGNIPPGARVEVEISVVQPVPRIDGSYELVLPLSIAPRFVETDSDPSGWLGGTDPGVTPEVVVHGNTGFDVSTLTSVNHPSTKLSHDALGISAHVHADPGKDFRLRWSYAFDEPQVAYLHDGEHVVVLVEPPALPPEPEHRVPRELVWVLDTSCSMGGLPWERTRSTMLAALDDLDPRDHFQIVAFSNDAENTFRESVQATPEHVASARAWVKRIEPGGGTYMYKGIRAAVEPETQPGLQRIVTFLSDGQIGTEMQTLQVLEAYRGDARVHSLAVGDAPNRYMMEQLAHLGGGRFMAPELRANPTQTAKTFMEVLERPVLGGLSIDWGTGEPKDVQPNKIPPLYTGQPLVLVARLTGEPDTLRLTGFTGDRDITMELEPTLVPSGRAVASTWARQQVQALQDRQIREPSFDPRPDGLGIALDYGVLSPWTSFIAIDSESDVLYGDAPTPADPERTQVVTSTTRSQVVQTHSTSRSQVITQEFMQRVPSGRTYQVATQMAAGVGVGALAGGNPNIGGAVANENTYLLDGVNTTDPVTGTFSTHFDFDAIEGPIEQALLGVQPHPMTNNLSLEAFATGSLGSGQSGAARVGVEGPVVRDRASVNAELSVLEDRGPEVDLSNRALRLGGATTLNRTSKASGTVALQQSSVDADDAAPWRRQSIAADLRHSLQFNTRVGLFSSLQFERATGTRTSSALQTEHTLRAELHDKHTLSTQLSFEHLDQQGTLLGAPWVDRLSFNGSKQNADRGGLVLQHGWSLSKAWALTTSVDGRLAQHDDLRGFLGGRVDLRGRLLNKVFLTGTAQRSALPLWAGVGQQHGARLSALYAITSRWRLTASGRIDDVRTSSFDAGQARGDVELTYDPDRRVSAAVRYAYTHNFGDDRPVIPGATVLAVGAPSHQLRAEAAWNLPLEPWDARVSAAFATDFGQWSDLSLGYTQRLPLRKGNLDISLRGTNLLGSSATTVLQTLEQRFDVVGTQRGRRVHLDVGWAF